MVFCQLYANDNFRDDLVMKPRYGPCGEGGPLLGWPSSERPASFFRVGLNVLPLDKQLDYSLVPVPMFWVDNNMIKTEDPKIQK
jgi:hypothetical protein